MDNKVVSVTNPQSSYFKEKGKILSLLPDEKVEVFLFKSEIIVSLNLSDINLNQKTFIPQSRKDFYEYIQKVTTSRSDISKTITQLIESSVIEIKDSFSKEEILNLINNPDLDKTQIVEEIRKLRDDELITFNLINSKPRTFIKRK
jgi:hypothetical protein